MRKFWMITTAMAALVCATSAQANLQNAKTVFHSGNWSVLRSVNQMKDTVDCTGIYKDNYKIQLAVDGFYVGVRGGMQGITLRFDDKPARPMRLPNKTEKEINSIMIEDSDFLELLSSNRLRVETLTLVRGIAFEDIDLTGIQQAYNNIKANCPVEITLATPVATASTQVAKEPICSKELKAKMKSQGIKEKQIDAVCKE